MYLFSYFSFIENSFVFQLFLLSYTFSPLTSIPPLSHSTLSRDPHTPSLLWRSCLFLLPMFLLGSSLLSSFSGLWSVGWFFFAMSKSTYE